MFLVRTEKVLLFMASYLGGVWESMLYFEGQFDVKTQNELTNTWIRNEKSTKLCSFMMDNDVVDFSKIKIK